MTIDYDKWSRRLQHPAPKLTINDLDDLRVFMSQTISGHLNINIDADKVRECVNEILVDNFIILHGAGTADYIKSMMKIDSYVENIYCQKTDIDSYECRFYYNKILEYDYHLHPNMKHIPEKVLDKFPKMIKKSEFDKYFPSKGPGFVIFPLHIDIKIRHL